MNQKKSKSSRSQLIDNIRGIGLLMVFYNHFALFFPILHSSLKKTYEALGYITFAEIFLMIAAYSILKSSKNLDPVNFEVSKVWSKAKSRFLRLYIAHLLTLTAVVIMSLYIEWPFRGSKEIGVFNPMQSYFLGIFMLFQPQLFDILPSYIMLSLANPIILLLLYRRRYPLLIVSSFSIWLLAQMISVPKEPLYHYGIILPYFNLFAWQFLYVLLLILILHKELIEHFAKFVFPFSLLLCAVCLAKHHEYIFLYSISYDLIGRQNMGIIRIINVLGFLCLCISAMPFLNFLGAKLVYEPLRSKTIYLRNLLSWTGRNSLLIFSIHIVVYHAYKLFFRYWGYSHKPYLQVAVCFLLMISPILIEFLRQRILRKNDVISKVDV